LDGQAVTAIAARLKEISFGIANHQKNKFIAVNKQQ